MRSGRGASANCSLSAQELQRLDAVFRDVQGVINLAILKGLLGQQDVARVVLDQ